jgi:hypothetical protein
MDPYEVGQVPYLSLILDHESWNSDSQDTPTIWNPEENLYGHLELATVAGEDVDVQKITIYFEGLSETNGNTICYY